MRRSQHGFCIHRPAAAAGPVVGLYRIVRPHLKGEHMAALYGVVGMIAVALLVYLVIALLKPELFS